MTDLVYLSQGLFTAFVPESKAGEYAWREMAKHTDGTGKVFTTHLGSTLKQLRDAGYVVRKAKNVSRETLDDILLDELLEDSPND